MCSVAPQTLTCQLPAPSFEELGRCAVLRGAPNNAESATFECRAVSLIASFESVGHRFIGKFQKSINQFGTYGLSPHVYEPAKSTGILLWFFRTLNVLWSSILLPTLSEVAVTNDHDNSTPLAGAHTKRRSQNSNATFSRSPPQRSLPRRRSTTRIHCPERTPNTLSARGGKRRLNNRQMGLAAHSYGLLQKWCPS